MDAKRSLPPSQMSPSKKDKQNFFKKAMRRENNMREGNERQLFFFRPPVFCHF
jgi:hypothetical protein